MEVRGAGGERRRGASGSMVTGMASPNPSGGRDSASDLLGPGDLAWGRPAVDATRDGAPPPLAGGYTPTI